jgi:scyllo-inositol 2-dehydrogenase (NADP+)
MNKLVNVGLIGFGMAGRIFHAPTISCVPGLRLKKIRQTNAENLPLINSRYPGAEVVADAAEIFSDGEIDLVVVGSPNATHYALAKEALLAGKNVVVDKPFTVTVAEAEELTALAKSRNRLLSVYQNRRWDSDFKTVQKVVDSGLLGRLAECEIHYDRFRNTLRPNTWKEGGEPGTGLLYDLGSHLIDQALTLFGPPQTITGDLRTQRQDTKIIDNFELVLDYPGLKVTLKSGMLVKEPLPRYILLGERGSFVKYGLDVQEEALNSGLSPLNHPNWGEEPEANWGTINTEYKGVEFRGKVKSAAGNYVAYYENVYQAILGKEELKVKAEDGLNVIRVIERARQSNAEKRRVNF